MALAHRATTPVVITVYQAATRGLQSPERGLVRAATTPAAIFALLPQTEARRPFIDRARARVALTPAVIIASRASNLYRGEAGGILDYLSVQITSGGK